MNLNKRMLAMALLMVAVMAGCKKDEPAPEEDNENLTTVTLKFTEGGVTKSFSFKDVDGIGGNAPVIDKIVLSPSKTYALAVEILDETKTPVVKVSDEIYVQRDEHLFEYVATPASLVTISGKDKDSKGLDVGLTATVTTAAVGTGALKVVLHHQPPVGGVAIKNGSFTVGSTDFEGTFTIEIK